MPSFSHVVAIINGSTYRLDMSGVVGLFGGNNAVDALTTIHLYKGRRWAGWYNYPGTATVAKTFGQMAKTRLWDSIFPGPNESPAVTFGLCGKLGPSYDGPFSGTKLVTRYLGYLATRECASLPRKELQLFSKGGGPGRKTGSPATVTVISLPPRQEHQRAYEFPVIPKCNPPLAYWAIVPSLVSIAACVLSVLGRDPLCASLIFFGIVSSGFSSLALGTATLKIRVPVPSKASPPGDGLMFPADGSVIVLKGKEADVNIVTKGEFELDYSNGILPHRNHHTIAVCSLLLMAQFLIQLLLIPRCTFFGQILFLISFIASGVYHLYVVSHETEKVQRDLLFQELGARMEKRFLGTRTQMAVFVCLILGEGHSHPQNMKSDPNAVLTRILPNETPVWRYWRRKVVKELHSFWKSDPQTSLPYVPTIRSQPEDEDDSKEQLHFTEKDKELLEDLIGDAWSVFSRYPRWRDEESELWQDWGDFGEEKAALLRGGSLA